MEKIQILEEKVASRNRLNPGRLLQLYSMVSVLSALLILVGIGIGIGKIYTDRNIEAAENDAIGISKSLFELEKDLLLPKIDASPRSLAVSSKDFERLNKSMRFFLGPLNIVKIKVFSRDQTIVYSTDHSIIGKADPNNEKLLMALGGEVVSKLETKDEIWDLTGEQRQDVDIVETYLPVSDGGEIVGSFEVYLDITRYQNQIKETVIYSLLVTLGVLVVVFTLLHFFMYRGTRELAKVQDDLENLSITDSLTGIFNRRHLFDRAHEEFSRLSRQKESMNESSDIGVLLIDIDYFKRINDERGHLFGDMVLKEFATRINNNIRKYDILGRYGGEEFSIIIPNAKKDDVKSVAEKIWQVIRNTPFEFNGSSVNVTCSIGATVLNEADENIESAMNRSDEAMYRAKNTGRDKVVCDGL